MFIKVWLSLGSNLGDRLKYLNAARQALSLLSPHKLEQSTIYESAPWGGVAKGTFLNQIIGLKLSSDLLGSVLDHEIEKNFISKYQLDSVLWLERLQFIKSSPNHIKTLEQLMLYLLLLELKYGRNRKADAVRWDSRTLDLDILAIQPLEHPDNQFNSDIFCHYLSPYLELPHPRLKDRQFILKPWFELVPQLYLSSLDAYLRDLLHDCPLDESLHVYSISL
ncbi:MAG: hypothetical protein CMH49_10305 [Myxococcales bacterium]|nr:hypothetical protein [Myxococcales bacterium]